MRNNREFHFDDRHFNNFRKLVLTQTGISLSDEKKELVYSRLSRRLRKLQLSTFDHYYERLKNSPESEMVNFVNSITTNLTAFFRENHHFDFLNSEVFPRLIERTKESRRIRIWSAGCSTGEEPYSIAMVVREAIPSADHWDIKILATDIDTDVLAKAKQGVYDEKRVEGISKQRLKRWFLKGSNSQAGSVKVRPELQELITFKQLNLMNEWPIQGEFDVIFCRNVVIYFDKVTQKQLFDKYAGVLGEDGHMFLGHSETLHNISDRFQLIGKTVYRKCA